MEKNIENTIRTYQQARGQIVSHCGLLLKGLSEEVKTLSKMGFITHIALNRKQIVVWIDPDVFFGAVRQDTAYTEEECGAYTRFAMEIDGIQYITYVNKEEKWSSRI